MGSSNTQLIGDFNGDGLDDMLSLDTYNNAQIYIATGNGFKTDLMTLDLDQSGQTYAGDFNGDGFADVMVHNAYGQTFIFQMEKVFLMDY